MLKLLLKLDAKKLLLLLNDPQRREDRTSLLPLFGDRTASRTESTITVQSCCLTLHSGARERATTHFHERERRRIMKTILRKDAGLNWEIAAVYATNMQQFLKDVAEQRPDLELECKLDTEPLNQWSKEVKYFVVVTASDDAPDILTERLEEVYSKL